VRGLRRADRSRPPRGHAGHAVLHQLRLSEALNQQPPATRRQQLTLLLIALALGYLAYREGMLESRHALLLGVLIPSIILHEVSHGAAALAFGDDTAKRAGRLTLNPIAHVDPFGTIILPAILILTTGAGFGWAKPVPVNPGRMRSPRNHGLLVSLAGPGVNIALAIAATLVLRGRIAAEPDGVGTFDDVLFFFGLLNVILAVFNLIPIPPLDGSAVIERMLPAKWWPQYLRFRQYSFGLLLVVVLFGVLDPIFKAATDLWFRLLR
jgi:Zn-dependent protease